MDKEAESEIKFQASGSDSIVTTERTYFQGRSKFYENVKTVVDCGAGSGSFSLLCTTEIPAERVYSYDGFHGNFSTLLDNVRNNSAYSVVPDDHHVSGRTGRRYMNVSSGIVNALGIGERWLIETRKLDDILIPPVDLIRVAVPGDAPSILEGGRNKIHGDRPALIVETVSSFEYARVRKFAAELGYKIMEQARADRIEGVESMISFLTPGK